MSFFEDDPEKNSGGGSGLPGEPRLLTRRNDSEAATGQRTALLAHVGARWRRFGAPDRADQAPRRDAWRKRALWIFFTLLACSVCLLLCGGLWLRHAMRASLPQLDGSVQATGLAGTVTVTRDDTGVPSIRANSLDDLLFAQGYVTAQDRLWQMDALRRHAAGELAEILGPRMVEHDKTQRLLQIRAAADRAVAVMPADQLHQLQAYANGVNAFITQNADRLPVEFHILHYTPQPWTPRDSMLVSLAMAQDLGTEFPTKLMREALSAHLPSALLSDLYPVGSWRDHPPAQEVPDLTSPHEVEQIPLDSTQTRLEQPAAKPDELLEARAALSLETCEGCRSGSNNWVVAGARSASGRPLVSNDMHLALGVPDIWYEASLHVADGTLDVAGLTLPGTPFVIVGRNAHVAWGFTNLGGDVQDVYIEHLRGSGAQTEYERADGTWVAVGHHSEHIRVRGGSDVTLDVITTVHPAGSVQMDTPIISSLYPFEHRALSLAWTIYDPSTVSSPFLAVDAAADGAALVTALASFGGPSLNLLYADDQNHIGYHAIGRIPVRGPAVQHPLAGPQTVAPDGTVLPPTEDDSAVTPPAESTGTPGYSAMAFHPEGFARRRNLLYFPARRMPLETAYRRRRRPRVRTPRSVAKQPPVAAQEPAPAPPLTPAYTIGSPIPAMPIDALDPNAQWSEYVPYTELPAATDPASGFLATANARIAPDGYPYALALDWASPYRVERIAHLLEGASGLTPADMLRMQMDVHSEFDLAMAQRFAYALDHAPADAKNSARRRQAADILRRWNGNVDVNAPAAAIVAAARAQLWPMLLVPQIEAHDQAAGIAQKNVRPEAIAALYSWGEQGFALEELMLRTPARWLPPQFKSWNDLLVAALDRGLTAAHAPSDLSTWSYGKAHPVEIGHPLLSGSPLLARLLGVRAGSGQLVLSGDTSTVKATSRSFGPSERFNADMSDAEATTSNLTTGESGNPASAWYLDQLPDWVKGTTLPLPLHRGRAVHTLTLQP